MTGTVGKAE